MKDLAIIISKLNGGGAERSASNISLLLSENYNIHMIVFDGSNIKYPYKGKMHNLNLPPSKNKLVTLYKRIQLVRKIKKDNNIVASISFMDGPNLVNVLSRVEDKIYTSVRIRMSSSRPQTGIKGLIGKSIMKVIGHKSDKVIALSKGVEEDLVKNYHIKSDKVKVIYNPCDGELLLKISNENKIFSNSEKAPLVTTMGRLNSQKGQWHLIRAFVEVIKSYPNAKLCILGEGELKVKLEELAKELGISDNVRFMGFIEAPHAFVAKSDVFVFPSLFEGLGNVLLEAMACGVACISADCPSGPREILTGEFNENINLKMIEYAKYGVLVPVCGKNNFNSKTELSAEEKCLAEAIITLLKDEELRKKYENKSIIRCKDFEPIKIKNEWLKVIGYE